MRRLHRAIAALTLPSLHRIPERGTPVGATPVGATTARVAIRARVTPPPPTEDGPTAQRTHRATAPGRGDLTKTFAFVSGRQHLGPPRHGGVAVVLPIGPPPSEASCRCARSIIVPSPIR